MAKITIEELSESLKEYLNGLGLTEAQVQELIDNMQEEVIGNKEELATSDKSSIVAAINELFQSANNGKELIANAIGEPLDSNDTFSAMSNDINGLLSTFKTNMMNNGITVESSDKFKSLIDKLKGLTEGGGNKGIRYVEGNINLNYDSGEYGYGDVYNHTVTTSLDFVPTIIFVQMETNNVGSYPTGSMKKYMYISNLTTYDEELYGYTDHLVIKINNISANSFNINITAAKNAYGSFKHWYAIGVGEEDTTLRDSLADILENKGVDVTEEDDMASLISKVDGISSGLDIISATTLPATGKENQICVITENPVDSFMMSSDFNDVTTDESSIVLYLGNTATGDATEGTLVKIVSDNLTTNYYFVKVCQGENRLDSYIYQNGAWELLTQSAIYFIENGVERNNSYFGGMVVNSKGWLFYNDDEKGLVAYGNNGDIEKFGTPTNKINFSLYNYIEVKASVSDSTSTTLNLGIGTTVETRGYVFPCNSTFNSIDIAYATSTYIRKSFRATTGQTQIYDISSWTGEGYLVLHCTNGGYGRYFRILDMKFY